MLNNRVRIKPNQRAFNISLRVVHSCEGKGVSFDLSTNSRVPCTVEVIDLKGPLLLSLERIDNILEISTKLTVWGKELDEFIGGVIIDYLLLVFGITDHSGVGEVPILSVTQWT